MVFQFIRLCMVLQSALHVKTRLSTCLLVIKHPSESRVYIDVEYVN